MLQNQDSDNDDVSFTEPKSANLKVDNEATHPDNGGAPLPSITPTHERSQSHSDSAQVEGQEWENERNKNVYTRSSRHFHDYTAVSSETPEVWCGNLRRNIDHSIDVTRYVQIKTNDYCALK